jgi:cytochrome d ubiquinol oxidase subunit I
MRTNAAVTGAHGIPIGYGVLAATYLVVACGLAWVLRRLAAVPLDIPPEAQPVAGAA